MSNLPATVRSAPTRRKLSSTRRRPAPYRAGRREYRLDVNCGSGVEHGTRSRYDAEMSRSCFSSVAVALALAPGCDAPRPPPAAEAGAIAASATPTSAITAAPTATVSAATPPRAPRVCGTGPEVVFDEPVMERAVRAQLARPSGPVQKSELARVKTLNLTEAGTNAALDPCIIPLLTGIKGLYLAQGTLDDISLLSKLTALESLRLSM